MARRTGIRVVTLGLVSMGFLACDPSVEEVRERLFELRSERTALLDEMYEEYRTSVGEMDLPGFLQGPVGEVRLEWFEVQVRSVGEGDRPKLVAGEAKEFFNREEVRTRARRVVELDQKIADLERRLEEGRAE